MVVPISAGLDQPVLEGDLSWGLSLSTPPLPRLKGPTVKIEVISLFARKLQPFSNVEFTRKVWTNFQNLPRTKFSFFSGFTYTIGLHKTN